MGLPESTLRASVWHASPGQWLTQGDRLLEVVASGVLVDIPSPESGILRRRLVSEDEPVAVGQTVALVEVQ
jgi:pyruvate/2-oxoglutarate dehydrogenase complex dihydrolipoamide acyltransferase (E2) component